MNVMFYDGDNFFDYSENEEENKYVAFNISDFNVYNFGDREEKLMSLNEGFSKGNMFYDIYKPYKNHIYEVKVYGEKDNLLLNIQMLEFAINDLVLCLDLKPDNKELLNKFNEYNNKLANNVKLFEEKYGPLSVNGMKNLNTFTWSKNPWPWDKGGNM